MICSQLEEALIPGTSVELQEYYASLAQRAKDACFGLDEPEVVILDTETTGLSMSRDDLIEIAAVIMKGPEILSSFQTFVNPIKPLPAEISALTGIYPEDLLGAPSPDEAVGSLARFAGERMLIAHNAAFDKNFIMKHAHSGELTGTWVDSLELSRLALPRLRSHSMSALASALHIQEGTHRAMADVESLCCVWRICLLALSEATPGLLSLLLELYPQVDWALRPILKYLAGLDPVGPISLRELRIRRVKQDMALPRNDAEDVLMQAVPRSEIEEAFSAQGLLGQMYPGYESRKEQLDMALELHRCFEEGGVSAIEAGTGVGKSMAYLLPAAYLAKRNGIGIGVATKTNALMDQLIYHELPRLAKLLPGGLRYTAIKGYEHYPCLRKMYALSKQESGSEGSLTMLASIICFLGQSDSCDLDDVPLHWSELPRSAVAANPGDCLHKRCPYFPNLCLLHGLRQRAKCADVLVTNHALLFRNVGTEGALLPPIRHWIVDEAHAAEDEARKQLSLSVHVKQLRSELQHLEGAPGCICSQLRRKAPKAAASGLISMYSAKIEAEARRCDAIAESLNFYVKDLSAYAEKSSYENVEMWVNQGLRDSSAWGILAGTARSLSNHLELLCDQCNELASCVDAQENELNNVLAELKGCQCYLKEMSQALSVCADGDDKHYVYTAGLNRRQDVPAEWLAANLIDVGEVLNELFYPQIKSLVYTSATIATGESFDRFMRGVGMHRLPAESCNTLRLSSSYDFQNNMTVLVCKDMPEPGAGAAYRNALARVLYDVHCSMGGSTLSLFTNRKEMEQLFEELEPRLRAQGIKLICQSKGYSAKRLKDEFIGDKKCSLFALKSFWEGFDAPGDTLRCVIIPKLPFARPNDPLHQELELRESNAWSRYALPEAILDLKQAAGRLIRCSTDRGVLLLCDTRLLNKSYGGRFLNALPSQNQLFLDSSEIKEFLAAWE